MVAKEPCNVSKEPYNDIKKKLQCLKRAPRARPPAPMNHEKIFKGWPTQDAPSKLVQLWYKTFQPDQRGQVEIKNPTKLSNKIITA